MLKPAAGVFFAITLAAAPAGWAKTPLTAFEGRARVLVVSGPCATDQSLVKQDRWLRGERAGLQERDVAVIRIVGARVETPSNTRLDARSVRAALGLRPNTFGVALVGKDGFEALRQAEPITMNALFAAIDAMPMRRRELERRKP